MFCIIYGNIIGAFVPLYLFLNKLVEQFDGWLGEKRIWETTIILITIKFSGVLKILFSKAEYHLNGISFKTKNPQTLYYIFRFTVFVMFVRIVLRIQWNEIIILELASITEDFWHFISDYVQQNSSQLIDRTIIRPTFLFLSIDAIFRISSDLLKTCPIFSN